MAPIPPNGMHASSVILLALLLKRPMLYSIGNIEKGKKFHSFTVLNKDDPNRAVQHLYLYSMLLEVRNYIILYLSSAVCSISLQSLHLNLPTAPCAWLTWVLQERAFGNWRLHTWQFTTFALDSRFVEWTVWKHQL